MPDRRRRARTVGYAAPPEATVIREDLDGGKFDPPSPDICFESVTARNVDFSNMRCWRLTSTGSRFEGCTFDAAEIEHGPLSLYPRSTFHECSFRKMNFRGVEPGEARFEGCQFVDVRIEDWFAYCTDFVDCTFSGTIKASRFSGKPIECASFRIFRRRLEFRGNDFRSAALIDTEFCHGIDLDDQILPEGDEYIRVNSAKERIDAVSRRVAEWPNAQAREEMLIALDALASTADDQRDIFMNRDVFVGMPPDLRDEMWRMLEKSDDA